MAGGVAWLALLLRTAPAEIVALAVLPILAWALLGLYAARRAGVPTCLLGAALLWGAVVAAPLSGWSNDALRDWPGLAGAAEPWWRAIALAPLVEEIGKGMVLLLLPLVARRPGTNAVRAGIALGAASGLGFAATENVSYLTLAVLQGGLPGLLQATWARGILSGVKHALFTASLGAGAGFALRARSAGSALAGGSAGMAAAVLQHAAWNGLAAPVVHEVVCDAPAPGAACAAAAGPVPLLVIAPLVVLAALAPGALALLWVARRARSTLA